MGRKRTSGRRRLTRSFALATACVGRPDVVGYFKVPLLRTPGPAALELVGALHLERFQGLVLISTLHKIYHHRKSKQGQ